VAIEQACTPHLLDRRTWKGTIIERAQTVLDHSTDLAAATEPHDTSAIALHLFRVAGHDHTTLDHALHIGRTRVRRDPASHAGRRAVQLLESVIGFVGHKPRNDD
jgi:hypothetical protein